MKIFVSFAAIALLLGHCSSFHSRAQIASSEEQIIEYPLEEEGRFTVIVVEDEGIDTAKAKKLARQKAAEVSFRNGYRYFTVESEEEVQVVKSNKPWPNNQAFYGNMYQELIIERDFDKEQFQREDLGQEETYQAIRLIFQGFEKKPNWRAIDVCTLVECHSMKMNRE